MSEHPLRRIAYLVSRYPALSHSFIRREVKALRSAGIDVKTFTVRRTDGDNLTSEADQAEARRTRWVLPTSLGKVARAHAWAMLRSPARYLRTLRLAAKQRTPGTRAFLWSLFYFGEAMVLAKILDEEDVEHLHNHFANAGSDVGVLSAHYLKIPWSLTLHGNACFSYPSNVTLGSKIEAADFVNCVSEFGRSQAMREVPMAHWDKIRVVRCGIDLEEYRALAPAPDRGPRVRLLCVARLSEEKGLFGLLDAVARLAKRVDVELHLVGHGPQRAELEARRDALGLGDRVSLTGPLAGRELIQEYREADVFVLASLMEGLPVVLMEAMYFGVPVVAPQITGIPELVEHEHSGLLFPAGNWDALADRLERLASDSKLRAELAVQGRERVLAQHDIRRAIEPLVDLLRPDED